MADANKRGRSGKQAPAGLLLTPGAGSDRNHHTLIAIENAVAPLPVERLDFPYRVEGRKAPDRAPKLIAAVVEAGERFATKSSLSPEHIVFGGRSMGGRICSMAVSEGLVAMGLVLISYPLHPPGKPDRLRVEHFPKLDLPCLFISGTRDPFGTPDELTDAINQIPGPVDIELIEGGRHDLANADETITKAITAWLAGLRG